MSMPPKAESKDYLRTLGRGLQVLRLLENLPTMGFLELHRRSGLPKASLARILHTLEHDGWISRRLADGHYRISQLRNRTRIMDMALGQLAELASGPLRDMHGEILWPSDVAVCDGRKMLILESNRLQRRPSINARVVHLYPTMLWSAVGRAYLAHCEGAEQRLILRNLRTSAEPDDQRVHDKAWIEDILTQTRQQGYGVRAEGYDSPDQMFPGQLDAIAVPICAGERTVACLNLVWMARVMTREQVLKSNLSKLKNTAKRIGDAFAESGILKPLWRDARYLHKERAN